MLINSLFTCLKKTAKDPPVNTYFLFNIFQSYCVCILCLLLFSFIARHVVSAAKKNSISSFFHLANLTQNTDTIWHDLGATAVIFLSLESIGFPILCLFFYSLTKITADSLSFRIQEPFPCSDQWNQGFKKSQIQW